MNRSPFATLFLGVGLLAVGFLVGYGFQSGAAQNARVGPQVGPTPTGSPSSPPLVKGLHSSPDGSLLAWTGVWDKSSHAGIWVLNVALRRAKVTPSPVGWQDFVSQWRADGRALLIDREKIPRAAAEAKAGLFQVPVDRETLTSSEPESVMPNLPSDQKLISGTFAPDGELLIKTRREPKSLFLTRKGEAALLDRAEQSYGQNRAVKQNGRTVIYAVRDAPGAQGLALFRVADGKAQQLSPLFQDVSWSYVSPSGRYLVVAREDSESGDYVWSLYEIEARQARLLRSQTVTGDAISVYWSPDEKQILGAAGKSLWSVSIPGLQVRQIGKKSDWNADDATWIGRQNAVAIAANGELWSVDVKTGKEQSLWKFPAQFWD